MTTVRALNALAVVICQAQENGRVTSMGIAFAVDAAGMLASPETAAELVTLRAQVARLTEQCDLWHRGDLDTTTAIAGMHGELHGHTLPEPGAWDRERNAELSRLRDRVAELEEAVRLYAEDALDRAKGGAPC